jgi:uncharacterized protein YdhG (YjbR/CyaY superfamily)
MVAVPRTVEDYVAGYPSEVQEVLRAVRQRIVGALPGAEESISYGMPTVTLAGRPVLYIGAWKQHLGLYPVPESDELEEAMAPYRAGRGTLRFRYRDPIPYDLIARIATVAAGRA